MNYVEILNKIFDDIKSLEEVDQYTYDLFMQMYFYNIKILKAVSEKKKVDASDVITLISEALGVKVTDLVQEAFRQLKHKEELKESTENLSNEEKKLIDQVLRNSDVVKDVKNYNFETFIKDFNLEDLEDLGDLGELEGTKGGTDASM